MVYFYYANIVGYIRIALLIFTTFIIFTHPITTVILYALSQALDFVDGPLARKFN